MIDQIKSLAQAGAATVVVWRRWMHRHPERQQRHHVGVRRGAEHSIASARDFYMYLAAGTYSTFRILMTAADGSLCSKTANSSIKIERGKITTITLSGLTFTAHRFSTSSTTSVVFAPGNLQYQASTGTWRFAERQYDYIGDANANISSSYSGWIDLFCWGTSGWNSGNHYYMPYDYDYSTYPYSEGYGYGPTDGSSYTYNLIDYLGHPFANADWGVFNAIRNGGNTAGQWHAPSDADWNYILFSRSETRYAKAQIGGKSGVILFPDSYSHPAGLTVLSSTNTIGADFTTNTYSVSDWLQMEAAGAVFLLAAGFRSGTSVDEVGTSGDYWSSSCYKSASACSVDFVSGNLYMGRYGRCDGFSVRLVRD